MPPKDVPLADIPLPVPKALCCSLSCILSYPDLPKLLSMAKAAEITGFHYVGFGAKDAFQNLDQLDAQAQGIIIDEVGNMNELFLNPEHFIQLCPLACRFA